MGKEDDAMYKNIFKYDEMKRAEHMAVRTTVGWYFFTHQIVEVTGEDAEAFLDHVLMNDIATLQPGRNRYTVMLNDAAEIIDDVVVMRRSEDCFWVSTLFSVPMDDWFYDHQGDYDVDWDDVTDEWNMFSVQGPKSKEVIEGLVSESIEDLKFFSHAENEINGIPVIINRTGFTGEKWGFEVYIEEEYTDDMEEILREACDKVGGKQVTDFQVMSWTLPTEAGFYYMRDLKWHNPFEVDLGGRINWDKDFIGKEALKAIEEKGAEYEMVGFEALDDDPYIRAMQYGGPGEAVYIDGEEEEVGRVAKLVYSYLKDVNNGYIFAKKGKLKVGDKLKIHGYDCVIVEKNWLNG